VLLLCKKGVCARNSADALMYQRIDYFSSQSTVTCSEENSSFRPA